MKKLIATAAVAAAAAGSLLGFAGHADAQSLTVEVTGSASPPSLCVTVAWELPAPPVAVPVGLPVTPPNFFHQCLPPDALPGAPGLPPLPV